MNRAISAASEGFVDSIQLALTLPVKILSAALSVLLAFVNHRTPQEGISASSDRNATR